MLGFVFHAPYIVAGLSLSDLAMRTHAMASMLGVTTPYVFHARSFHTLGVSAVTHLHAFLHVVPAVPPTLSTLRPWWLWLRTFGVPVDPPPLLEH